MPTTHIESLLTEADVLRTGHFRLSSGAHSDTYLQCAAALQHPGTALRLGRELAARAVAALGHDAVDVVASPALGGILAGFVVAAALDRRFVFAERGADRGFTLRRGQQIAPGERVLVVEDVVTTGLSAREVAALVRAAGGRLAGIACIVDRSVAVDPSRRPDPPPISLLAVGASAWDPGTCPLCAAGRPLDTPGSRHSPT